LLRFITPNHIKDCIRSVALMFSAIHHKTTSCEYQYEERYEHGSVVLHNDEACYIL